MWDDNDRDDPVGDETASRDGRRRADEPLDLPLGPGSTAVRLPKPQASKPPDPASPRVSAEAKPPAPKKKKAPPLFPDWVPPGGSSVAGKADSFSRGFEQGATPPEIDRAVADNSPVPIGRRALAGAVDLGLGAAIAAVLALAVRLVDQVPLTTGQVIWTSAFAVELSIVGAVLSLFLFARTPGMALAELAAEEADGLPIRFQRAVGRVLGGLAASVVPGSSLLVAAIREDGRSLADLMSATQLRRSDDTPVDDGGGLHLS